MLLSGPGIAIRNRPWRPSELGSLLLGFWDAERSDKMLANGTTISEWTDLVGGYTLSQGTSSFRPVYEATSFRNHRPGVTFDGTDDYLELASQPFPSGAATCEVWALFDQTQSAAVVTTGRIFDYGGVTSNVSRGVSRSVVSGVNRAFSGTDNAGTVVTVTDTTVDFSGVHLVRVRHEANGMKLAIDGNALQSSAPTAPTTGAVRVRMGARTTVTPGQFLKGIVNAVIITKLLSDSDAALMTNYLKTRGGLL